MNERIKVLMGFAGLQPYYDSQEEQMVKFAELIVRECAELVDRAISDSGVDGRAVKEHFGIDN